MPDAPLLESLCPKLASSELLYFVCDIEMYPSTRCTNQKNDPYRGLKFACLYRKNQPIRKKMKIFKSIV